MLSNRFLAKRGRFMQKRYLRLPVAAGIGGVLTYAFNLLVLRPIYYSDIKELGLDKYLFLDLNADMMK